MTWVPHGDSVGAKGGHLGAMPPLAVINAPPTPGHYFIYFPDNDRRSIHYPLLITRVFSMLWNAPFACMGVLHNFGPSITVVKVNKGFFASHDVFGITRQRKYSVTCQPRQSSVA